MKLLFGYLVISFLLVFGALGSRNGYVVTTSGHTLQKIGDTTQSSFMLDLSHMGLVRINDDAFQLYLTCPRHLYLIDNKLTTLSIFIFQSLTRLEYLALSKNQLTSINFIAGLPKSLKVLLLDNNKINSIAPSTFSRHRQMLELNLSHNNINNLNHAFVGLENLTKLDISFNNIQSINRNSFIGLSHTLSILDLSGNHIEKIESKTFSNGIPQNYLDLSYNEIHEIQAGSFLSKLEHLNLEGNLLTTVNPEAMKHILDLKGVGLNEFEIIPREPSIINGYIVTIRGHTLQKVQGSVQSSFMLDLSHMGLVRIADGAFGPHLNRLTHLYLINNKLSTLANSTFSSLHNLEFLTLSKNQLTRMNFVGGVPNSLKVLVLDNNKINYIAPSTFSRYRQMSELNLSCNIINNLNRTFDGLENLEKLDISFNNIQSINRNSFIGLTHTMSILDLSGNHIEKIDSKTFSNGIPQNFLDLSYNDIHEIQDNIFHSELKHLNLEGNLLTTINLQTMKHISDLKGVDVKKFEIIPRAMSKINGYHVTTGDNRAETCRTLQIVRDTTQASLMLDLSHMGLVRINDDAFQLYLTCPRHLYLIDNKLTTLSIFIFQSLTRLEYLALSKNQLTSINFIAGLPKSLKVLLLDNNKINSIAPSTFSPHRQMLELNLSHNNINNLDHAFVGLENLKKLDISINNIQSINRNSFIGLTHTLSILDLSGNHIEKIESRTFSNGIPQNYLNLSYNEIHGIQNEIFHSELKHLNLEGNLLTTVNPETMRHIPDLKGVDLNEFEIMPRVTSIINDYNVTTDNRILISVTNTSRPSPKLELHGRGLVKIAEDAFLSDLDSLRAISLSQNKLTTLPCSMFTFLPNLRYLSLSHNQLTEITFFRCVGRDLMTLLLNNNTINSIAPYTFSQHSEMLELNLAHNNIRSYTNVFYGLTNLQELDISSNKINSINRDYFVGLTNKLLRLNLSHNYILEVKNGTFPHGVPRNDLELAYNYIDEIQSGSFHSELKNLNLERNHMSTLNPELFKDMSNLESVNLRKNGVERITISGYTVLL